MKKYKNYIKIFLVLISIFFITCSNRNNITFQITTEEKPKFSNLSCLEQYGGKVSNLEYGTNNDVGGKVTMDVKGTSQYRWHFDKIEIDVGLYSRSWQNLQTIKYRIYTKNEGTLCEGTIADTSDIEEGKASAEFRVTFDKSSWVFFEVTGVDTSKKGEFGPNKRQIKIDKEIPKIIDVKAEISEDRELKIFVTARDYYSGIDSGTIDVTSPTGGLTNIVSGSYEGEEPFTEVYYRKIDLEDKGEGDYKAIIYVSDKVYNTSEVKEITFSTIDSEGKNITGNINLNQETVEESFTHEEEKKQKEEGDQQDSNDDSVPSKTKITNFAIGDSQKIQCDNDLKTFIKDIWKIVVIIAPILLIIMITVDFLKAVLSSNDDLIKKASTNSIKRTIATLILICLPLLLSTILEFFGLSLCL